MVIVFFGTPQFAVPTLEHLLASRHRVALVVTQPDRPRGRGQKVTESPVKVVANRHHVPVVQPPQLRETGVADLLRQHMPDLGVVAAYGQIITDELLAIPRHGMINVHASLLPKYRGAAPVHRAVMNGDPVTGVTIMRVARKLDTGDMLAHASRPIGPDETSESVERALAEIGARLLLDVVGRIEAGTVVDEPQDDAAATYAPRLRKEEGLIDWTLPAQAIHNRVRGLYPWPHAYSYLAGERVILLRTQVVPTRTDTRPAAPGSILDVTPDAIVVATGSEPVAIVEIQPEGKRAMGARDFAAGRGLRAGMRFERA